MKKIEEIILRNTDRPVRLTILLIIPFIVAFVLLIAAFYLWDNQNRHHQLELQMKETARAHYEQVVLARLWNARHGGVYVEVTEDTPPNPYLDDPDKTITTSNGKTYTKLNPAYMTRQLSELAEDFKAFKIRITGINPKNPSNSPDPWEEGAILSFREGKIEASAIMNKDGQEYFRYMGPLVINEECLACHGAEGYRVGDIKGGISVSIPVGFMKDMERDLSRRSLIAFGTIGVFAVSLLIGITLYASIRLGRGLRRELESERLEAAVKVSGAAAHELRQPMTIISGFSELLKDKIARGEDIRRETEIIIGQCDRMNSIITRMLNVTAYRTKAYGESSEIFDLGLGCGEKTEEEEEKDEA